MRRVREFAPPFRADGERGFVVTPGVSLRGTARVPGDKSLSHRALILAAMAEGTTRIRGLNTGDDVACTRRAVEAMGARIESAADGAVVVHCGALHEPSEVIDCGNSGTALRLLAGVAAGLDGVTVLTGDASLRRRPVDRVIAPLALMGARCDARAGGTRAPLVIRGGGLRGVSYDLPIASAQIKSATLLAGLRAHGRTEVREPHLSRDHTERMLRAFGVDAAALDGPYALRPPEGGELCVSGDPSAAAFLVVGALLCPDSDVLVENVCVNPTRAGWIDVLRAMGADITLSDERDVCGEPVATLRARTSALHGADIAPEQVPSLVDEAPVLAVAQACARGRSVLRGAADLRVKESDRIASVGAALRAMGADVSETADGWIIEGVSSLHGAPIATHDDHRIAMSCAIAGLAAQGETRIDESWAVGTSFPEFFAVVSGLSSVA